MRYATIRHDCRPRGARIESDTAVVLDCPTALEAWTAGGHLREIAQVALADADLAPVSPHPAHIACLGLNYRSHIEALARQVPTYPTIFAKYTSTLTGPRDPITLPFNTTGVQGEVELAVIVGRRLRHGDNQQAAAAIAGYAVANDVSMRDWQHRTSEALQGKVFDHSTPLGPLLVTPDEVDDARDLRLTLTVDGTVWQTGSSADMVWSPAELIAYCSSFMTLEPGDVILTGTPNITVPDAHLQAGVLMEAAIEGLGECRNTIRAEPHP